MWPFADDSAYSVFGPLSVRRHRIRTRATDIRTTETERLSQLLCLVIARVVVACYEIGSPLTSSDRRETPVGVGDIVAGGRQLAGLARRVMGCPGISIVPTVFGDSHPAGSPASPGADTAVGFPVTGHFADFFPAGVETRDERELCVSSVSLIWMNSARTRQCRRLLHFAASINEPSSRCRRPSESTRRSGPLRKTVSRNGAERAWPYTSTVAASHMYNVHLTDQSEDWLPDVCLQTWHFGPSYTESATKCKRNCKKT